MTNDPSSRDLDTSRARARLATACYVTAFRVVRVLAASAAAVTTLALLALVERLVATPAVTVAGTTVPLTQVVAAAVVAVLARRLYALNTANGGNQ